MVLPSFFHRRTILLAVVAAMAAYLPAQLKERLMPHHATGTFEIKLKPLPDAPAETLKRMSFEKQIHGGLEGSSKGEMISAGDPRAGEAGYVAIEMVTGKLEGKSGSFALQQTATMDKSGQMLHIIVSPGSGTGELKGIAGKFEIKIAGGQHSYTFEYTLPAAE